MQNCRIQLHRKPANMWHWSINRMFSFCLKSSWIKLFNNWCDDYTSIVQLEEKLKMCSLTGHYVYSDFKGAIYIVHPNCRLKKKSLCFHQCSAVMQSCFTRAAGSGGCAGTGFWITTPCPSITSGEGCLETSTLHTNGTMAGSSSLKVRVRNYDSLFQPWRWEAEPPPIDHDVFVSTVLYENKRQ